MAALLIENIEMYLSAGISLFFYVQNIFQQIHIFFCLLFFFNCVTVDVDVCFEIYYFREYCYLLKKLCVYSIFI